MKNLFPKKSLGQHFLTSEAAVFKIVSAAEIKPGDTVLEVGPGRGVLTRALLDTGAHVIAVEKDANLIPELQNTFAAEVAGGTLSIYEQDALEFDPGTIARPYKIVANLPYYITGQFIRKFLSEIPDTAMPLTMVLLLQKEVVERIVAQDKKESLLSISVKAYGSPRKVTVVNRGSFFPPPAVDSAVIAIEHISKQHFQINNISEQVFFDTLHAGFAHKRKKMISNMTTVYEKGALEAAFTTLGISKDIRAEDMTLEQWFRLCANLQNNQSAK